MAVECDIRDMFEGAIRASDAGPTTWWLAWIALGFLAGGLRWWGSGFERRLRWAWTDVRLLFQERGEGSGLQFQDVLVHVGAGMAASLSLAELLACIQGTAMDGTLFWRLWGLWLLISAMRSGLGHVIGLISGVTQGGQMWTLHHRWLMESAAWGLAPVGLVGLAFGERGAQCALMVSGGIWVLGWLLRQRRALFGPGVFSPGPLVPILYLCALEIIPAAVLFRAWKG